MITETPFIHEPTEITLTLGRWTQTYTLVETRAPSRYDFSDTIELTTVFEGSRIVLVPCSQVAYQIERYRSGVYSATPTDVFSVQEITDRLYQLLNPRTDD